jgi:para-nitrobenzyl esterase
VVSFDYRLGALGFLAAPALDDGSPESRSGNFGLMDQIAALQWVHENIASFGGDPARVTVFGQSAGASSILTLMASPKAEGLFSQAIIESGYLKAISRSDALELSGKLVSQSGCKQTTAEEIARCLRNLPASAILSLVPSSAREGSNGLFLPNEDGFIVNEPLEKAYALGHVHKIPVIMGTNADETSTLVQSLYGPKISTDQQLEADITDSYGLSVWNQLKTTAENENLPTPQDRLIRLSTDLIFTCPISSLLMSFAKESDDPGPSKTWRYVFAHLLPLPDLSRLGAFHGLEIAYVFGNLPEFLKLLPSERDLSKSMLNYWASFAKNGAPNGSGQPVWTPFQVGNESVLEFGPSNNGERILDGFRTEQCTDLKL